MFRPPFLPCDGGQKIKKASRCTHLYKQSEHTIYQCIMPIMA